MQRRRKQFDIGWAVFFRLHLLRGVAPPIFVLVGQPTLHLPIASASWTNFCDDELAWPPLRSSGHPPGAAPPLHCSSYCAVDRLRRRILIKETEETQRQKRKKDHRRSNAARRTLVGWQKYRPELRRWLHLHTAAVTEFGLVGQQSALYYWRYAATQLALKNMIV